MKSIIFAWIFLIWSISVLLYSIKKSSNNHKFRICLNLHWKIKNVLNCGAGCFKLYSLTISKNLKLSICWQVLSRQSKHAISAQLEIPCTNTAKKQKISFLLSQYLRFSSSFSQLVKMVKSTQKINLETKTGFKLKRKKKL